MKEKGKLYGIGLGPGIPELLTLRAVQILQEVPAIFVPRGDTGEESVARKIISPFVRNQEIRELIFPMTGERTKLKRAWKDVAWAVAHVLDEGKDTAFVTVGDSTLYSTYFYLLEGLKEIRPDLEVETVPGVTSFSAGAALLNQALAVGRESLAVIPATVEKKFLCQVLSTFDSVVLLKVAPVLKEVLEVLAELGRLEEGAYICRCGMPGQFLAENLAAAGSLPRDYFSLILVRRPVKKEDP